MKTLLLVLFFALFLSACSSSPHYQYGASAENPRIAGYNGLRQLSQEEVIQRTHNCTDSGMRPSIEYMSQQYSNGSVQVPVGVNCYPTWNSR